MLQMRWCNTFHISFHSIVNWLNDYVFYAQPSKNVSSANTVTQLKAFSFNELRYSNGTGFNEDAVDWKILSNFRDFLDLLNAALRGSI